MKIAQELKIYGDILQQDYDESYKSLVIKRLASIEWLGKNCPKAQWTVKADDDVFVNSHRLIEFYLHYRNHNLSGFYCKINKQGTPFRKKSKYFITKDEYAPKIYPPFCVGFFTICSFNESLRLLDSAKITRQIYLEDVFTGGILREVAGIDIHPFDPLFPAQWDVDFNNNIPNLNQSMVYNHFERKAYHLWTVLAARLELYRELMA